MAKETTITSPSGKGQRGITEEIKDIALRFARFIENQGITIERLIIFGSYAKNEANKESDIDICLVSPNFGKDSVEELQFLLKQRRGIDSRIEPVPVSSKEYRETATPFVWEIKKFGKVIPV